MSLNKILIVPDTNYFHNDEQEEVFINKLNLNSYYNFLNAVNFRGYSDEIFMFIPELVLCELISHHKRDLMKVLENEEPEDKLKNINVEDVGDLNFDNYCKDLKEIYCSKLDIIKIPSDKENLFNVIFKRALDKVPPFSKNSDSGFKDTIIFLSLLNPIFLNFNKIIIVSNDSGFIDKGTDLKNQFNEYFISLPNPPSLSILNKRKFFHWLDEEYEIYDQLSNYIENTFFDEILDRYSRNASILWSNDYLEIEDFSLDKDNLEIFPFDNKYEVIVYLSVWIDRSNDRVEGIFIDSNDEYCITQKEVYIFEKVNNNWCYDLESFRYEVLYDEWDESFIYDEYPTMLRRK